VEDEGIFDKYKLNDLCVYPRVEIKKLVEHISRLKSIKTANDVDYVVLKSRLPSYEKKVSESESEVYKLTFNIEHLRKQNETIIKDFDSFKEEKQKEIKKLVQERNRIKKDLTFKVEKLTAEKIKREKEKGKKEGDSLNLLRRKEHIIQNMKNDLENLESKLSKSNQSLLEQNERYEILYKEYKGNQAIFITLQTSKNYRKSNLNGESQLKKKKLFWKIFLK
jgi:chromosome segregation ATPase